MEEQIHLELYDPNWKNKFNLEREVIEKQLEPWINSGIHHVGSTAIPNMTSKPIIDIMVGVKNLTEAKKCIPILEKINYNYFPYKPDRMHWFCKPSPEHREFHLYLIEPTHPEWQARLNFRDYLRSHPKSAQEYLVIKTKLAQKFKNDREAYTEGKTKFITSILQKFAK